LIEYLIYFQTVRNSAVDGQEASWRDYKFRLALHERPEDRLWALERNPVKVDPHQEKLVRFTKTVVDAISTDLVPCTDDITYNVKQCNVKIVSIFGEFSFSNV
jgi:hypothetical protein